jgi:hypothetical protein
MRPTTLRARSTRMWLLLAMFVLGLAPLQCILGPEGGHSGRR